MKIKSIITNVTFPVTRLNDKYFIIGIDGEFELFDGEHIIEIRCEKIKETGFKTIQNKLYIFENKKVIQIDLEKLVNTVFLEYDSDKLWLLNADYFFYANKTEERREYKFDFFSNKEKRVLWSATDKLELTNLSDIFLIFSNLNRTIYGRYDFRKGEKIWQIDFSENSINGKIFNTNNVLVFPTTNQDLIGIEIETGKELWRLHNINANHFQVQPNTNFLVSFVSNAVGDTWYYVINPMTGEKIEDKKFEDFYYGAGGSLACITETHYYFISNDFGIPNEHRIERITHLGCINLQTNEIEWIEKIGVTPDMRSGYQKPEYHNGKFYLLDGEKTLHIYEIE